MLALEILGTIVLGGIIGLFLGTGVALFLSFLFNRKYMRWIKIIQQKLKKSVDI